MIITVQKPENSIMPGDKHERNNLGLGVAVKVLEEYF